MKLFEIFKSRYQWEKHESSTVVRYSFITDTGQQYKVIFQKVTPLEWELSFHQMGSEGPERGITKTRDAFKIFSTVIDTLRDFSVTSSASTITFEAKEPSRINLYDKLVQSLELGWKLVDISINNDGAKTYTLMRK